MEIVNKINRNNIDSLLENYGQSEMSNIMMEFANKIPEVNTIEDLKVLDKLFY